MSGMFAGKRSYLLALTAVVVLFAVWRSVAGLLDNTRIFDGYRWGIHVSILEIEGQGQAAIYTLRTKNIQKNEWQPAVSVNAADLAGSKAFKLEESLESFPADYAALSQINWAGPKAVGWPDENHLYVRHRELVHPINGKDINASYWGVKDRSDPLDLIIGADNSIIAAIDVSHDNIMVRRGFEAFTTVAKWQEKSVSQPLYGYKALPQHMMQTKANLKLATRVFLPEGDIKGPYPTIFIRTPYGISDLIPKYQQYAVRGFAVVLQAVRGTAYWDPEAKSEGDLELMVHEPLDGADALSWITEQPWSDGSICMQGGSYVGFTQWSATMAKNPALKCIVPESSMGTAFSDQPYMGGTYVEGGAFYAFWMKNKELLPGRTWPEILRHRPLMDLDEYATGFDISTWNADIGHSRNDEHWKRQDWLAGDYPRTVASLQISGWFDDDYPGTRSAWAMMQKRGTLPNRLLLGPWRHGYNHDRQLNGYSFGIEALRGDIWLIKQKWYDHFLKGVDNDATDTVVEYFVLGANEWRTAVAWKTCRLRYLKV
ncbi:MAG: CocE/NonD family hydrolase [Kordiimonadaceae bacterium]|nr:CocE/NonD family hydrolase [Kordiimonadaceae bacterium]